MIHISIINTSSLIENVKEINYSLRMIFSFHNVICLKNETNNMLNFRSKDINPKNF